MMEKYCRVCLNGCPKEMHEIGGVVEGDSIARKLELCGGIQVFVESTLPQSICNICLGKLNEANQFRQLCQVSQNTLIKWLSEAAGSNDPGPPFTNKANVKLSVQEEDVRVSLEQYDTETSTTMDDYIVEDLTEQNDLMNYLDDGGNALFPKEVMEIYKEAEKIGRTAKEKAKAAESLEQPTKCNSPTQPAIEEDHSQETHEPDSQDEDKRDTATMAFDCFLCNNSYTTKTKLLAHFKTHRSDKPHQCEICLKSFNHSPQLGRHMNSHTGNRPYACSFCDAKFADPSTKVKHERIHTKVRPYECEYCQKRFSYSHVLKCHIKTHTGDKPYSCDYCEKRFSQVHHKKSHEKTHLKRLSKQLTEPL